MVNTTPIECLDHGFVRLVRADGTDLDIVRAARVSYDADWRAGEDESADEKLIRYLMKNKHTSPFEAVEFTFEVKAPIFVFRQWHRHRTWSYNELSARYGEMAAEFYTPDPHHIGVQSAKSKQARDITEFGLPNEELLNRRKEIAEYQIQCAASFQVYKDLLAKGWPRELARTVVPVSAYSRMFAKVDLKNLLDFLGLRVHPHAQYEIRVYGEAIIKLITPYVPVTMAAWNYGR